jgi:hypothetical protein
MRALAIGTFVPTLRTLGHLFEKAEEHARTKGVDIDALVGARLAPDMYPFSMQVQLACYQAKAGVARLTGEEPPPPPKDDEGFEALKRRVEQTVRDLEAVPEASFEGAEERVITMPLATKMYFESTGLELLRDWALPHFYFHIVTAYDILRHEGVVIGKRDYLRHAGTHIRTRE